MTSLPIYPIGTMIRLYTGIPGSNLRYTALVLPQETLLEVKNPHTKERRQFATMDDWLTARQTPGSAITYNYDKSKGKLIKNLHGFAVPAANGSVGNSWLRWCFSLMYEASAHLHEREDVRSAYNSLAELLEKHSDSLRSRGCLYVIDRYTLTELAYSERADCGGLRMELTLQDKVQKEAVNAEIATAYKVLHDCIYSDIERYIKYKQAELRYNDRLKQIQKQTAYFEKQVERNKSLLRWTETKVAQLCAESKKTVELINANRSMFLSENRKEMIRH